MSAISKDAAQRLFSEARTFNSFLAKAVDEQILRELYDLMKWGQPNSCRVCLV